MTTPAQTKLQYNILCQIRDDLRVIRGLLARLVPT